MWFFFKAPHLNSSSFKSSRITLRQFSRIFSPTSHQLLPERVLGWNHQTYSRRENKIQPSKVKKESNPPKRILATHSQNCLFTPGKRRLRPKLKTEQKAQLEGGWGKEGYSPREDCQCKQTSKPKHGFKHVILEGLQFDKENQVWK